MTGPYFTTNKPNKIIKTIIQNKKRGEIIVLSPQFLTVFGTNFLAIFLQISINFL
jgi:hypothetical protein